MDEGAESHSSILFFFLQDLEVWRIPSLERMDCIFIDKWKSQTTTEESRQSIMRTWEIMSDNHVFIIVSYHLFVLLRVISKAAIPDSFYLLCCAHPSNLLSSIPPFTRNNPLSHQPPPFFLSNDKLDSSHCLCQILTPSRMVSQ